MLSICELVNMSQDGAELCTAHVDSSRA
jgi:hypothetical protein